MPGIGILQIIQAAATIVLGVFSKQQRDKQQEEARQAFRDASAVILGTRPTNAAGSAVVPYGRTVLQGIPAYPGQVSSRFPSSVGRTHGTLAQQNGERNQFLLIQYVLAVDGIDGVADVWVDGATLKSGVLRPLSAVEVRWDDTASRMATSFTPERTVEDRFTGLTFATAVFKHDPDDPEFAAAPQLQAFLRGRQVPTALANGALGARVFTANLADCVIDYLTADYFGPGFTVNDLDMVSFRIAQTRADVVVQGLNPPQAAEDYPDDLNDLFGSNYDRYDDYYAGHGLSGRSGLLNSSTIPVNADRLNVKRYEFNGGVDTAQNYPDVIDVFKAVAPGAYIFRRNDGRWKIVLPDARPPVAETETFSQTFALGAPASSSNTELHFDNLNQLINVNFVRNDAQAFISDLQFDNDGLFNVNDITIRTKALLTDADTAAGPDFKDALETNTKALIFRIADREWTIPGPATGDPNVPFAHDSTEPYTWSVALVTAILTYVETLSDVEKATGMLTLQIDVPTGRTVPPQLVGPVIDDSILITPASEVFPGSSTKLNQATIRFANINQDFAEDTRTFPSTGSPADLALMIQDNQVRLHQERSITGIVDPYHALCFAANKVLISRRARYAFKTKAIGYNFEPGDVVSLQDSVQNISVYVRLETVTPNPDFTIDITGIRFVASDYSWITDDLDILNSQPTIDPSALIPATLVVTPFGQYLTVAWTANVNQSVFTSGYELEIRIGDNAENWTAVAVADRTTRSFQYLRTILDSARITFRIRSFDSAGRKSAWLESTPVRLIVVQAAAPLLAFSGDEVELDGSVPMDINGDVVAVNYQWTQISGPNVVLNTPNAATATFEAPPFSASTPSLALSTIILSIIEGATGEFRVRLGTKPTGDVTVAVVSGDVTVATVSSAELTFTSVNWDQQQAIIVTTIIDPDNVDDTVDITLTPAGADYNAVSPVIVRVTVDDV